MDLETKACMAAKFKLAGEESGPGSFSGYAAHFGSIDRAGERIVKGAFADSLPGFLAAGFVADNHNWDRRIGYPVKAYEDETGLFVECAFHSTGEAQNVRTVLREREAAGLDLGLSIGYKVAPGGSVKAKAALDLTSIKLYEVSPVSVPCNPLARAAGVKGGAPGRDGAFKGIFEDELAERQRDPWALFSALQSIWYDILGAAGVPGASVDPGALADEALAEFGARWREALLHEIASPDAEDYYGYSGLDAEQMKSLRASEPLAGLKFAAHADAALATVEGFLARAKEVTEMRAKEGRQISAYNRDRIQKVHDHLEQAMTHTSGLLDAAGAPKGATAEDAAPLVRAEMARYQRNLARANGVEA